MESFAQYGATLPKHPDQLIAERNRRQIPFQVVGSPSIRATILIPVYNEEAALPHVLSSIFAVIDDTYEVLVIDDGSQDATQAVAAEFPCRIVSHVTNQGKGAAMITGFRYAHGEHIVVIDGDATYPASAIPEIVEQLGHYDVVRGVRSDGRDNIPLVNRVGNQIFDQIIKRMHQVDGADMLSGLYGLHKRDLLTMRLTSDGFDIESEIMIKARAMRLTTHNIPIQYNERIGEKKLAPMRDGIAILARIVALAVVFNPFVMYIVPGVALCLIGLVALAMLSPGIALPVLTGLSIHAMIVSAMSFLAGFQLVMFGCVANMYAAETGLGQPSRTLSLVAAKSPRMGLALLGIALIGTGTFGTLRLAIPWVVAGGGFFDNTRALVIALALVVWGMQLVSTSFFLSLFAGSRKYMFMAQHAANVTEYQGSAPDADLERAVGEA
jgi:hypothetical protein